MKLYTLSVQLLLPYCQNPNSTNSSVQQSLRLDYILTPWSKTHPPTQTLPHQLHSFAPQFWSSAPHSSILNPQSSILSSEVLGPDWTLCTTRNILALAWPLTIGARVWYQYSTAIRGEIIVPLQIWIHSRRSKLWIKVVGWKLSQTNHCTEATKNNCCWKGIIIGG